MYCYEIIKTSMDDKERRAAFIRSYRQHRRGWTHSNAADLTNSLNSTVSSQWSCNNLSSINSESLDDIESVPYVAENTSEPVKKDLDMETEKTVKTTITIDPPEGSRNYMTSSSSFISSSLVSNDPVTSSQDNGPSSDVSTPESNLKTFPMLVNSKAKLIFRKSSDDDDCDVTYKRTVRTKRNLRRLTPRHRPISQPVASYSSPYPSSVTSSTGHWSTSESISDDERASSNMGMRMSEDLFNQTPTQKQSVDTGGGKMFTVQEDEVIVICQSEDSDMEREERLKTEKFKGNYQNPSSAVPRIKNVITINVSGKLYEVETSVLDNHPDTLLGNPWKRRRYYDKKRDEYFLDRHRDTFEVVLEYYTNGGILRRPDDIPIDIFINEIKFYSFERETLEQFLRDEGILHVEIKKELPQGKTKKFIWQMFEDHEGTILSQVITIISALVIALSVVVFCLETIDGFESYSEHLFTHLSNAVNSCESTMQNNLESQLTTSIFKLDQLQNQKILEDSISSSSMEILLQDCFDISRALNHKYALRRCLTILENEKNKLSSDYKEISTELMTLIEKVSVTFRNQGQRDNQYLNRTLENGSENLTTLWVDIRSSVFHFVHQTCLSLDNLSSRTPYEWLVMEAGLGGRAGILFMTETACIFWFVTELTLRFLSCPNKKKFAKSFLNLIDFVAILPYFITLVVTTIETKTDARPQTATVLRTIRLVRMLRILKLSRYSRGFRILGLTLVRSTRVLFLLVCFQIVLAVLFSSIAYFVEYDAKETKFHSIPETFWWALITMTTVGYGDVYPVTIWGKLAGACCAIMGILCISFPVPVIVSNFNYLYHLDKEKFKLVPEDLMDEQENRAENFETFRENLFQEMRRSVSGVKEEAGAKRNPAELWNMAKRNYRKVSLQNIDARLDKSPSRSSNFGQASTKSSFSKQSQRNDERGTSV